MAAGSGDLGYVVIFSFIYLLIYCASFLFYHILSLHNNSVRTGIITYIHFRHCIAQKNVRGISSCLRDIATRTRVTQAIQSLRMDASARGTQGISSPMRQDVTVIAMKKDQVDILTVENAGKGVTKIMGRFLELASLQQS